MTDFNKIWSRQIPLFEEGFKDQEKLRNGRVVVSGAGGLGSAVLYYLSAAGTGNLLIIDKDTVDETNLNRQILYNTGDIGRQKAKVASERISLLNPYLKAVPVTKKLEESKAEILDFKPELIVDCLDNLDARLFLNKIAHDLSVPFISAVVQGFEARLHVVYPFESACLSCIYEGKKSAAQTPPVIGVTPGIAGVIEAAVAINIMLGRKPLKNKLLRVDLREITFKTFEIEKRRDCPVCSNKS